MLGDMRVVTPCVALVLLCLLVRPLVAAGQEVPPGPPQPAEPEPQPEQGQPPQAPPAAAGEAVVQQNLSMDTRRQGSDDIVAPSRELEISTSMAFVTSRAEMASVPELYFTDVGLWRSHIAFTPVPRVRLVGAVELLAKQPATLDEHFFQNGALGIQISTSKRTALAFDFAVGSLLGDIGYHGSAGLALQARKRMNEVISWEGRLGVGATNLWYDVDTADNFWFAEAGGSGEVQFCWGPCKFHYGATWFALDLAVPVYHHPDGPDERTMMEIDPRTRLGFTMGSFFKVSKRWDMFLSVGWVDRGDAEKPTTQLPILDGGFDQVQLGMGIIAHWQLGKEPPPEEEGDGY
jgi:hypothetical protein